MYVKVEEENEMDYLLINILIPKVVLYCEVIFYKKIVLKGWFWVSVLLELVILVTNTW